MEKEKTYLNKLNMILVQVCRRLSFCKPIKYKFDEKNNFKQIKILEIISDQGLMEKGKTYDILTSLTGFSFN